jgi:hypothetical protein
MMMLVGHVPGNGMSKATKNTSPAIIFSMSESFWIVFLKFLYSVRNLSCIFESDFSKYLFCMPCRFYISPFFQYFSRRVEEKSGTNHSDIYFSIVFLFSDDSKLFMEFSWFVSNEFDAEIVLIAKFLMRCFRVFWYSDYLYSESCKFAPQSCEILSLESTTWSIIFWIEVEECLWWFFEYWCDIHMV